MYFCKTRNHVWSRKEDARKCCNGFSRVPVFGGDIPDDAENIYVDQKTGLRYARIWMKDNVKVSNPDEYSEDFSEGYSEQ